MRQETAVDGFRLAYERLGPGPGTPAVLMLHGWPGDRTDYRAVAPPVSAVADVVVPDLRGFGESDKHEADPARQYNAVAQARSLIVLIEELGLVRPVLVGYDIGSRIAQAIARDRPDLVRALVIAPPLPGIGDRILQPKAQQEFWYQAFHQLELCTELIDGQQDAVRSYLRHFWSHWSGPDYEPTNQHLDHLLSVYGRPGAFAASIAWYRAGAGSVAASLAERAPEPDQRIAAPTSVLWPEYDPLFPREWSDRIGEFFAAATLTWLNDVGHFSPVEAPDAYAAAITAALASRSALLARAHRGPAGVGKDARWLGVGAALLTGLAVLLAILAFIVYYDIFIGSASLAGYVSSLLSYSLASLVGYLLWRRPGGADRYWFGAGVLAAVAGGGAAHLAGHLGWGHPLLFTLISDCGYAVCAACIGMAVVIVNRSARRDGTVQ
jgi:pimeloyl-ACP methyl ester carboxylesterase